MVTAEIDKIELPYSINKSENSTTTSFENMNRVLESTRNPKPHTSLLSIKNNQTHQRKEKKMGKYMIHVSRGLNLQMHFQLLQSDVR